MDISQFKSGNLFQQYQYKSFTPALINHAWEWEDQEIDNLLLDANNKLGDLSTLLSSMPAADEISNKFIIQEALSSCRIEGAELNLNEFITGADAVGDDKKHQFVDIENYIEAIQEGITGLKRLPLSTRVLNNMHAELMNSELGEKKTPGEFRKSQNWVGGKTLKEALYIPPAHEELSGLIGDLENFIHNEEIDVPHLIKLAIIHYQFITIHPYLDGNGKIGRLLILLYLHDFGLLNYPVLNLSEQLEKSKTEYLVKLGVVRDRNALDLWIKYFLNAIIKAADLGIERMNLVITARETAGAALQENGIDYFDQDLINRLFNKQLKKSELIK